jgi:hypothetical protein
MIRRADAWASSTMVGARSMFATNSVETVFPLNPGCLMMRGRE